MYFSLAVNLTKLRIDEDKQNKLNKNKTHELYNICIHNSNTQNVRRNTDLYEFTIYTYMYIILYRIAKI